MAKAYKPPKYRKIEGEKWLLTAGSRRGLPSPKRFGDVDAHKKYIKGLGYNIRCFKERDGDYYCWAKYTGKKKRSRN